MDNVQENKAKIQNHYKSKTLERMEPCVEQGIKQTGTEKEGNTQTK